LQPSIEAHRTALGQVTAKRQRSKTVRPIDSLDASALLLMCGIVLRADSAHRCVDLRARDDDGGSAGRGPRTNKRPQRKLLVWAEASGVWIVRGCQRASHRAWSGKENAIYAACLLPRDMRRMLLLSVAVMEHVHGQHQRAERGMDACRRAAPRRAGCLVSSQRKAASVLDASAMDTGTKGATARSWNVLARFR
jgi:hypothetical protein